MKPLARYLLLTACLLTQTALGQINTDRITAIGRNALYFEDYVLSIQYFNQVIRIKPWLAEPYVYRAMAKTNLGDYRGAEADCSAALERNPFLPGAYYIRGYVRRQLALYAEAEADLTRALEFSPDNKVFIINRADARAHLQKYDEALADMDLLIRREPRSPDLYMEKGSICLEKADTACALQCFDTVVALDPRNAAGWSARGFVHMATDNEEAAYQDLCMAINLGSKWAGDYMNRGVLNYKRNNYRGALADYDRAVELAADNAQCYYNRGLLRTEVGDYNNALLDYDRALDLEPQSPETHYQRGVVRLQLRQWHDAQADFDTLIAHYPYFLPAYYLASQAAVGAGNIAASNSYQKKAFDIEQHKEEIRRQQAQINTDAKLAKNQNTQRDFRKEFSNRAAQNIDEEAGYEYDDKTRGNVQKVHADVINEPNFVLSYYSKAHDLRRTNYYCPALEAYNKTGNLPQPLKITCQEVPLPADLISHHFDYIDQLSARLNLDPDNADLYFARAMEFATVLDLASAIDDLTHAIRLRPDFALAYFCRANLRAATEPGTIEPKLAHTLILHDYDYVLTLLPDFSYAAYNKANMLCSQKDYEAAIAQYDRAISLDPDMAEAWFNRGLTKVFVGRVDEGVADLSQAGQLGIYQAYNIITKFTK